MELQNKTDSQSLQLAGFSTREISDYIGETDVDLRKAGFSEEEISDYFSTEGFRYGPQFGGEELTKTESPSFTASETVEELRQPKPFEPKISHPDTDILGFKYDKGPIEYTGEPEEQIIPEEVVKISPHDFYDTDKRSEIESRLLSEGKMPKYEIKNTTGAEAMLVAAPEGMLTFVSGLGLFVPATVSGIAAGLIDWNVVTGEKVFESVQAMGYEPRTLAGKETAEILNKPFEVLSQGLDAIGTKAMEVAVESKQEEVNSYIEFAKKNPSVLESGNNMFHVNYETPEDYADDMTERLNIINPKLYKYSTELMGLAVIAKAGKMTLDLPADIRNSNWWKQRNIKERALVLQDTSQMINAMKSEGMTQGQIARALKKSGENGYFETLLKERTMPEATKTVAPKPKPKPTTKPSETISLDIEGKEVAETTVIYRKGREAGKWWSKSKEYVESGFPNRPLQTSQISTDAKIYDSTNDKLPLEKLLTVDERQELSDIFLKGNHRDAEPILDNVLERNNLDGFKILDGEMASGNTYETFYLKDSPSKPQPTIAQKIDRVRFADSVEKEELTRKMSNINEHIAALNDVADEIGFKGMLFLRETKGAAGQYSIHEGNAITLNPKSMQKRVAKEGITLKDAYRRTLIHELEHDKQFQSGAIFEKTRRAIEKEAREAKPTTTEIKAYHGTATEFVVFSKEFIGENQQSDWGDGISFSDKPEVAKSFAKDAGGDKVIEVTLDLKNPATNKDLSDPDIQMALDDEMGFKDVGEVLQEKGFDGIAYTHGDGSIEYVVYDMSKIKRSKPTIKLDAEGKEVKAEKEPSPIEIETKTLKIGEKVITPEKPLIHEDEPVTPTETKNVLKKAGKKLADNDIELINQKNFLLGEIDNAINNAKTEADVRGVVREDNYVDIDVPGDGEFKIINTKEALNYFKGVVEKHFPAKEKELLKPSHLKGVERRPEVDRVKSAIAEGRITSKEQPIKSESIEDELKGRVNEAIGDIVPPAGLSIKEVKGATVKEAEGYSFKDTEVEKRWQSSKELPTEPMIDKVKEMLINFRNKITRGVYEHLPREVAYAQIRFDLLEHAKAKDVAIDKTLRNIQGIAINFGKAERNLFDRKVILDDLVETAAKGKDIPFGFTEKTVNMELNRINTELSKHPEIQKAVELRRKLWEGIREDYISVMKDIGKDISYISENKNYFRHQVLDYAHAKAVVGTGSKLKSPVNRGSLKKREGSELDIISDYILAEAEVMSQILYDIETAKLIRKIDRDLSIADEVRVEAKAKGLDDWHEAIPEGYVTWQPREGNVFYMVDTVPAKIAGLLAEGAIEDVGLIADELGKALARGVRYKEFVVKEEIAATLDSLVRNKDVSRIVDIDKKILNAWKQWQLISPRRFAKYNTRNLIGDAEGAWLGNPSTFRKSPRAFKELFDVFFGDKSMTQDMQDWFERGGMQTTLQFQEMGEVKKLRMFQQQYENKTKIKDIPIKVWSKYWSTVRLVTDFREVVLRYAAYLDYVEQMKKSPNGTPKNFGASIREEVMALSDIKDRAFKLQNELLGAYDDISVMGQALREHLIPFWSFNEINFKRYSRLYKNAAQDAKVSETIGRHVLGGIVTTSYTAYRIGKFIVSISALWAALWAWNHFMFPEEEEALSDEVKKYPHIIFGKGKDGEIVYFTRLGILGDLIEWVGLNGTPQYVENWLNGKMTAKEIAIDMAKSPVNKVVQGLTPFFKMPAELLSQKQLFPDFSKPRTIRDNGLYLAQALGLENEYKALAGIPSRPYAGSLQNIFIYKVDPYQSAHGDIYDVKRRFLKRIGKGGEGSFSSPRGDALYNFKLALRYGNNKAAEKYLLEYASYGGTKEGLQKSLENMSPLAGLTKNERIVFYSQLSQNDKEKLVKALIFYDEVLLGKKAIKDKIK